MRAMFLSILALLSNDVLKKDTGYKDTVSIRSRRLRTSCMLIGVASLSIDWYKDKCLRNQCSCVQRKLLHYVWFEGFLQPSCNTASYTMQCCKTAAKNPQTKHSNASYTMQYLCSARHDLGVTGRQMTLLVLVVTASNVPAGLRRISSARKCKNLRLMAIYKRLQP